MNFFKSIVKKYKEMSVVGKASLWFVICGFFQRGISTITTPVFSRLLQTTEYGSYNVFNSWLEIITILTTLKLGHGVYIQGLVKYDDDQDKMSSALLGLATTWWFCSFIIYMIAHDFWNNLLGLSTYTMICMFIMMISTVGFNFWSAKKRNEFEYLALIKLTVAVSILKPVCGIISILLTENYKVEARIGSLALVEFLAYFIFYIQIMCRGKRFYDKNYWEYALAFNIPLIPHFLSQVILNHSDRIMIQKMVGFSEAGIYSLAYSLAMVLTMLNTSIQNTLKPWMFQKMKAGQYNEVHSICIGSLAIVGISNLMLIAFAPELVSVFAPPSYQEAVVLISPITMGVFFAFMYNLFVNVQMFYEKTKSVMTVSIVCALVNIVLNYHFINLFGYIAAAYTTLISYFLMALLHYFSMKKIQKRHNNAKDIFDMRFLIFLTVLFVILGSTLGLLSNFRVIRYSFIFVLCIALYVKKRQIIIIWRVMKET